MLEEVRFDALFTFIFSPRVGTPAANMDDPMPREEKLVNFNRLTALQDACLLYTSPWEWGRLRGRSDPAGRCSPSECAP